MTNCLVISFEPAPLKKTMASVLPGPKLMVRPCLVKTAEMISHAAAAICGIKEGSECAKKKTESSA